MCLLFLLTVGNDLKEHLRVHHSPFQVNCHYVYSNIGNVKYQLSTTRHSESVVITFIQIFARKYLREKVVSNGQMKWLPGVGSSALKGWWLRRSTVRVSQLWSAWSHFLTLGKRSPLETVMNSLQNIQQNDGMSSAKHSWNGFVLQYGVNFVFHYVLRVPSNT